MNTIQGILDDLENEETVIGGCTTPGEVIITLKGLVEENNLLKNKLKKLDEVKQIREEIIKESFPADEDSFCCKMVYLGDVLDSLDKLVVESED